MSRLLKQKESKKKDNIEQNHPGKGKGSFTRSQYFGLKGGHLGGSAQGDKTSTGEAYLALLKKIVHHERVENGKGNLTGTERTLMLSRRKL